MVLNVPDVARSSALRCSDAQGRAVGDVCGQWHDWLAAAGRSRVKQLPEQGQVLHSTVRSGKRRGEPEKGYQPKRWLLG